MLIQYALKILLAYCLGGLLGGDVLRWLRGGVDLRTTGSGNVGATNALRARGLRFALGVLVFDVGKGVCAVLLIPRLPWIGSTDASAPSLLPYFCGYGVLLGHCFPLYQRFRGGKGIATLAGVFGALFPALLPILLAIFVVIVLATGYVSLASMAASAAAMLIVGTRAGLGSVAWTFTAAVFIVVLWKHRLNLVRLTRGEEGRFEKARLLRRRGRP